MGKPPAFQFYVRDWLSDPQLKQCSFSTKGMWIDLLCFMWEAPERGVIKGTIESIKRMLGATDQEMEIFLNEVTFFCFANVTCNSDVTFCNTEVTIINRRMWREQQNREKTRKRVQKHREKKGCNGECNIDVTPPSSSSSSCTKVHNRLSEDNQNPEDFGPEKSTEKPTKKLGKNSKHFSEKIPEVSLKKIIDTANQIQDLAEKTQKPFKPFQFIQQKINKNGHPEALMFTLEQLHWMWESVSSPWPWSETVYNKKNAVYNEHDSARENEKFKAQLSRAPPDVKKLLGDIG